MTDEDDRLNAMKELWEADRKTLQARIDIQQELIKKLQREPNRIRAELKAMEVKAEELMNKAHDLEANNKYLEETVINMKKAAEQNRKPPAPSPDPIPFPDPVSPPDPLVPSDPLVPPDPLDPKDPIDPIEKTNVE